VPTFAYRAVDARGQRSRGRLDASSESAVVRDLESRGLLPVDVREAARATERGGRPGAGGRRAVLEFTRAMAALLPAGMPLSRALTVAATSVPPSWRPSVERVRERVERGDELARALAEEPALFSPLYVGVVRAGEKGGALGTAFQRLGAHLEREDELRSKLVSMSIYPAMLCFVGLASVMVLVLFVMPRFAELLTGSGAPLPRSTAMVLGFAAAARTHWPLLAAAGVFAFVLLGWMRTTRSGRRASARLLAHAPLVGVARRQVLAARFSRMAGELLNGGAPLISALRDTEECIDDPLASDVAARIRTRVREGSTLNHAIAEHGLFPPELVQLVALGEESGRLAEFLLKAAELLERRTERTLERMVALVEPVMIVSFGGLIALVALSLLQAIYGVNAGGL
jgi:type II secretory pathway component PulF